MGRNGLVRIEVGKSSSHHISQNEIDSDYPCFSTLLSLEPHPKASRTFAERILATLEDIPLPAAGAKRAFGSTLVLVLLVQPIGTGGLSSRAIPSNTLLLGENSARPTH